MLLVDPVWLCEPPLSVVPECVWLGSSAVDRATVFEPPVAATAYELPAPTINLSRKSGVLFRPSQMTQPLGILAVDPDQSAITPEGMPPIPVKLEPSTAGRAPEPDSGTAPKKTDRPGPSAPAVRGPASKTPSVG